MRGLLLLILFLHPFIYSSVFAQKAECDCSKFRTGKYVIDNLDGSQAHIDRKRNVQKEVLGKVKGVYRIKWISECSLLISADKLRGNTSSKGKGDIMMTIVETGDHHYVAKVKAHFVPMPLHLKVYEEGYMKYDIKR